MIATLLALAVAADAGSADRAALDRLCTPFRNGAAVDLQGQRFAPEQAFDPADAVVTINARQSVVLLPDRRFLLRTSTIYPGGIEFRYRTVGTQDGEQTIDELGWRDGDTLSTDDAKSAARDEADLRMLVPGLLGCDALSGGQGAAFDDRAGRRVTLTLDKDGRIAGARVGEESYAYSAWRLAQGVAVPGRIERTRGTRTVARWGNVRIRPARAGDASLVTLPNGYRPADPAGQLRATRIDDGVYRIDGAPSGYHTGFVVGARGVIVFDAPVNADEARTVRQTIEQVAAGRPITRVVISHVHGDHIGGLPVYAGAEILTGRGGSIAVSRQHEAVRGVREIITPETIDLGDRQVRIEPIASAHSPTMLVGYDPRSGVIFQGDLFYLPERGPVPAAFATGAELLRLIDSGQFTVHAIVGVHGRTGTLDQLRDAVTRMNTRGDRGCIGVQLTQTGCQN